MKCKIVHTTNISSGQYSRQIETLQLQRKLCLPMIVIPDSKRGVVGFADVFQGSRICPGFFKTKE